MPDRIEPHNIHDLAPDRDTGRGLFVSVVIPVYNRAALLERTLAALGEQTDAPRFDVHIGDDGSTEDIAAVVASASNLDAHHHRRERDRFGAGQARNLAAGAAPGDVIIFLDSDCVVEPDFVIRHASWHRPESRTVVIGGRSHAVMGSADELADYRKRLRRRTAGLQTGNEIFRSFVTANVSLPTRLFNEIGGFDERFHRWGGEDTELGWRLWNSGVTFIDDESIAVRHQVEQDHSGGEDGRREAHALNMGLIASLIPHSFYRKEPPPAIPGVPKVSVILNDVPSGAAGETWEFLQSQPRTDFELIVVADLDEEEPLAGASVEDPRLHFTADIEDALDLASGEYICFLNGHGAPSWDLLRGLVHRLDRKPMSVTGTVGYALPPEDGGSIRGYSGARDIDAAWNADMPLCWAVRTREVAKLRRSGLTAKDLWPATKAWDANLHWTSAAVRLPSGQRADRPAGFTHRAVRRQELAVDVITRQRTLKGAAVTYMLSRNTTPPTSPENEEKVKEIAESPVRARYVGWSGHYNLGDEVMLEAVRGLLPWAELETTGEAGKLLVLGGGTLINRSSYLRQITDRDTPRVERCVLGTGVASPEYWGIKEDPRSWIRWLRSCAYVGVRGPHSLQQLESWGLEGIAEVSGDSALLIERPAVEPVEGRIVVAPAWTKGALWGGSDELVVKTLAESVRTWIRDGHEVVALASSPDDDGQILQIGRETGLELPFVQGYLEQEAAIELIASADVVVGERLHACVLAAAVGTPFVALEYRPKLRDFAASVGVEHLVARTDDLSQPALADLVDTAVAEGSSTADGWVETYRRRLREAALNIERAVLA